MSGILLAASIVAPMALKIGLGVLIRAAGFIDRPSMRKLDSLNFQILLPVLLFINIISSDSGNLLSWKLAVYAIAANLAMFVLAIIILDRLIADPAKAASAQQAVVRCNYVIFGLVVASSLYGDKDNGVAALLGVIIIPLSAVLAVIILERQRNGKTSFSELVLQIIRNPFIISSACALLVKAIGLELPGLSTTVMGELGQAGSTLSFLSLGVGLDFSSFKTEGRSIIIGTLARTAAVPLAFIPLSAVLGFRGQELCALIILFATPAAVSSYSMAVSMKADGDLAASLVVTTTLGSIVTIFLSILIFESLGWL